MNCLGFEDGVAGYLDRLPSRRWLEEARAHAAECPDCAELWRLVRDTPSASPDRRLTRAILEQTSGLPCRHVRRKLREVEDISSQARISRHLDRCPECRLWALWTTWQHTPPQPREGGPLRRFGDYFESLLRRPRFGLEAAYTGTVLFLLLLGNPGGLPERIETAIRLDPASFQQFPIRHTVEAGESLLVEQLKPAGRLLGDQWARGVQTLQESGTALEQALDDASRTLLQARGWAVTHLNTLREKSSAIAGEPDPQPMR